jgi:gluconate 5-dehydrogenase
MWAQHDIQINGIGPGYFLTDMTRPLAEDETFSNWLKKRTSADRWGDPRELVGTSVFLAPEANRFVNGQIIYVDGGMLAAL